MHSVRKGRGERNNNRNASKIYKPFHASSVRRDSSNTFVLQVRRRKKILVHCGNGTSTSVAVVTVYRLLKQRVNVRDTLSIIGRARGDLMDISLALEAGLYQLQEDFALENERRLVERARTSSILSLGF